MGKIVFKEKNDQLKRPYKPDGLEDEYGRVPRLNSYNKSLLVMNFIKKFQGDRNGFTYDDVLEYFKENDENPVQRKAERLVQALKTYLGDDLEESPEKNGRKKVWLIKGINLISNYGYTLEDLDALNIALKAVDLTCLKYQYKNLRNYPF